MALAPQKISAAAKTQYSLLSNLQAIRLSWTSAASRSEANILLHRAGGEALGAPYPPPDTCSDQDLTLRFEHRCKAQETLYRCWRSCNILKDSSILTTDRETGALENLHSQSCQAAEDTYECSLCPSVVSSQNVRFCRNATAKVWANASPPPQAFNISIGKKN